MIKINCKICNKEVLVYPCNIKKGRKFCSRKCRGIGSRVKRPQFSGKNNPQWRGGKIKRDCLICNKEFYVKPSIVKIGGGKFCSIKCNSIHHSKNLIGEKAVNWKGVGKIKKLCAICNNEFTTTPWLVKFGKGIFCSKRCRAISNMKNRKTKDTSIELAIERELIKKNIPYTKQVPIKCIALVDFLLPNKIIIQCDGNYWHSRKINKGKDIAQDTVLGFNGYTVYRFTETEINKSAEKCIEKIKEEHDQYIKGGKKK